MKGKAALLGGGGEWGCGGYGQQCPAAPAPAQMQGGRLEVSCDTMHLAF